MVGGRWMTGFVRLDAMQETMIKILVIYEKRPAWCTIKAVNSLLLLGCTN